MAVEEAFQIPPKDWIAPIKELFSKKKVEVVTGTDATQMFLDGLVSRITENPKYLDDNKAFADQINKLGVVVDHKAALASTDNEEITVSLAVDKNGRPIGSINRVRMAALYLNPTVRETLEKSSLSTAAQVVTRLISNHRVADQRTVTGRSRAGETGHSLLVADSFVGWKAISSTLQVHKD